MGYIVAAALACFVVWQLARERARTKQIRVYARDSGFTYIGAALPRGFPLGKTSLRDATVSNAVAGEKDNAELVLFDCRIGTGKGRCTQTLVAVRGLNKEFGAAWFDPNLITERVDDWTLIYLYGRVLTPEQIEALVSSIGSPSS